MRIALVDAHPSPKVYSLALLKIGAWRQDLGDECKLFNNALPKAGDYDEIWISVIFTFHIPNAIKLARVALERAEVVKVGGVAVTLCAAAFQPVDGLVVHTGMIPEAEKYSPDYGLLGFKPEYSIVHTSRGCVRNCSFCAVPKVEPEFTDRPEWENDLHPDTQHVQFYDNNWLAKPVKILRRDVAQILALIGSGRITTIDFNQGLDARLCKGTKAELLAKLPLDPLRFAFDNMSEDGHYQDAVRLMLGFRPWSIRTYVLYNHEDTPQELYYRLRATVELAESTGHATLGSFPMRYHPTDLRSIGREFVGKHWTRQMLTAFNFLMTMFGPTGSVFCNGGSIFTPMEEFEYWFTKDRNEFAKMLRYPKSRELFKRKKGALRTMRAEAKDQRSK